MLSTTTLTALAAALALSTTFTPVSAAHHHKELKIDLYRWPGGSCASELPMGREVHLRDGTCKNFKEGAFGSFSYGFHGERRKEAPNSDWADCKIEVWSEKGCQGSAKAVGDVGGGAAKCMDFGGSSVSIMCSGSKMSKSDWAVKPSAPN